jgi:tetratricopeptide (TPR) repeat protein
MSLKRQLLIASAIFIASTWVHSQGLDSRDNPALRPPQPFAFESGVTPQGSPDGAGPQSESPTTERPAQPRASATPSGDGRPWALPLPAALTDQAAAADKIDLSALRYFAGQNDMARVAAEIRLLRAKYPGWEPPKDIFFGAKDPEAEKALWDLFAKGDFEGVRAAIAQAQQSNRDWQPSADLMMKLSLAEANRDLVNASDEKRWDTVIDIAASNKMLLTCDYVDAIWRTAEALVHTDQEESAIDAYRYILTSCGKPHERLATVQKAAQLVKSSEALESLMKLGKRLSGGKSEFESVRLDLVRKRIGDAAADKSGAGADEKDVAALIRRAETANDLSDQQLLGWYFYSHKEYPQAERWFTMALQSGPEAKAAEGLVLTLRDASKMPDAKRFALQYGSLGPLNRKLMIEVLSALLSEPSAAPLTSDELSTFTQAVDDAKSADGAQTLGWRVYNANDLAGAQAWFQKSVDWQPNESAALGLVVTARRLNQIKVYAELVAKYKGLYPKVADFDNAMRRYPQIATLPSTRARRIAGRVGGSDWYANAEAIDKELQRGNYEQTLAMLDERRSHGRPEPAALSVVRGWARYYTGDWEGAKRSFDDAEAKGEVKAAKEGLSHLERGYLPPWLR